MVPRLSSLLGILSYQYFIRLTLIVSLIHSFPNFLIGRMSQEPATCPANPFYLLEGYIFLLILVRYFSLISFPLRRS